MNEPTVHYGNYFRPRCTLPSSSFSRWSMASFIIYFDDQSFVVVPIRDLAIFFTTQMTQRNDGFIFGIEETATRRKETFVIAIRPHAYRQPSMREFQFYRPYQKWIVERTDTFFGMAECISKMLCYEFQLDPLTGTPLKYVGSSIPTPTSQTTYFSAF